MAKNRHALPCLSASAFRPEGTECRNAQRVASAKHGKTAPKEPGAIYPAEINLFFLNAQ
jgi:hypothetical protein